MNSLFYMQQLTTWTDMSLYLLLLKNFMLSPSPPPLSLSRSRWTNKHALSVFNIAQPASQPPTQASSHLHTRTWFQRLPLTRPHVHTYLFASLILFLSHFKSVAKPPLTHNFICCLQNPSTYIFTLTHSLIHPYTYTYLPYPRSSFVERDEGSYQVNPDCM